MPNITIDPFFQGYFSPTDILASTATIMVQIHHQAGITSFFSKDKDLVFATDTKYSFYIGTRDSVLVFERNGQVAKLPFDDLPKAGINRISLFFIWSYTEIKMVCAYGDNSLIERKTDTFPIITPNNIIRWARKQSLLPVSFYKTEEEFRQKIHAILEGVQVKIDTISNKDIFWDVEYDGKKIQAKRPKREVNIQPIIQAMLTDASLMANVEVVAEYETGVGNLDFLFIGLLEDGQRVYFCVEVKNAHSPKIYDGLLKQLPAYMADKGSTYGAYCVLDYRGQNFSAPTPVNGINIDVDLLSKLNASQNPIITDKVRIVFYSLGKKSSASKL